MYQQFLGDHIAQTGPTASLAYLADANRHFRSVDTVGSLEKVLSGVCNGVAVAGDWVCYGAMVSDPEQRGKLVFSYEVQFSGNVVPTGVVPLILDRQGAAVTAAGTKYTWQNTTDFLWRVPPMVYVGPAGLFSCNIQGKMLVDASITSATPGITTREFGVGIAVRLPVGAFEASVGVQARLHGVDKRFFQPGK